MKAILLAAGEGIRMRPLTLNTPKPLLKVAGKSILEHLISRFPKEIDELILVIGYLGDKIKDYCGATFLGRSVKYVWQKQKLGTYHALELCRPHLKENESFMLFYSDDLVDENAIRNCLGHDLAVVCKNIEDPRPFGVVTPAEDNTVKEIVEKPENPLSNLVLANGYKLSSRLFDYPPEKHPKSGEFYLSVAISKMAKEHKIKIIEAKTWLSFGTPEDIVKKEHLITDL